MPILEMTEVNVLAVPITAEVSGGAEAVMSGAGAGTKGVQEIWESDSAVEESPFRKKYV